MLADKKKAMKAGRPSGMMILVQLVRNQRAIARSIMFGGLDLPLEDILDKATEDSRIRDPELDRNGSYAEVIWLDTHGRSYTVAKSVSLWLDLLSRKKPSSNLAPDWLRATIDRQQASA